MESPSRGFLFPGSQARLHAGFLDPRVALVVFGMQKVLQPEYLVGLQRAEQFNGIIGATVNHPARIHHQLHRRPDGFARRRHQRDVTFPILAKHTPAKLDRGEAAAQIKLAGALHIIRRGAE